MLTLTETINDHLNHELGFVPNLSFDKVLSMYQMLDNDSLSEEDKALEAHRLLLGEPDVDHLELDKLEAIIQYIQKRPYQPESNDEKAAGVSNDTRRFFSFTEDAEAIFASFLMVGIDLEKKIGKWPWDKFQAVFYNLPEESPFSKIVSIRQRDPSKLEGEEQSDLIRLQQAYALPEDRSVDAGNQSMESLFDVLYANAEKGG